MIQVKQYPDLMAGKKIMYVHGFASSSQSGTVTRLRTMLPNAITIAYDLPLNPHEAIDLLKQKAAEENPDLIIGTSMGGMYTEQLHGYDRIVTNPALRIADTMGAHGMIGKQQWLSPRQDGETEFLVTKALVKEYHAVQEQCFSEIDDDHIWGLFGMSDPLVHTQPLFSEHYSKAIWFDGEHRMDDRIFMNYVIPVIRWIDDRQEGRERPVVYIDFNTLCDQRGLQVSSAMKGFRQLLETYELFIVAPADNYDSSLQQQVKDWCKQQIGSPAFNHLVFTNARNLLYGDYLIAADDRSDAKAFMSTRIQLGSSDFKTWEEVITYFSRLGGQ